MRQRKASAGQIGKETPDKGNQQTNPPEKA